MPHIHIVGICGTFMGGLAVLASQLGWKVTGCDAKVYPPMSDQLSAFGIDMIEGFAKDQLALRPDLFVIGNVAKRGMPIIEAILDQNLPYESGPQWLGREVLSKYSVAAVAGTHGKTTTSSMLAWILSHQGLKPSYLIGGVPHNFDRSAHIDGGQHFVIEADEYDTAFFDKRSKFIHYRPRTLILNNLEFDHADIFDDVSAIETQFHHLVRTIPGSGRVIIPENDQSLQRVLARGIWSEYVMVGSLTGWHVRSKDAYSFEVYCGDVCYGMVSWECTGVHNMHNALMAIVAADHMGIAPQDSVSSLCYFSGVSRRMQLIGEVHGVRVYDDFAHHPTAIAATLHGMRSAMTEGRILAVLEPRSNTMRQGQLKELLPQALAEADWVFVSSRDLSWDAHQCFESIAPRATIKENLNDLVSSIVSMAQDNDKVIVMSNGSFGGIHTKILEALSSR